MPEPLEVLQLASNVFRNSSFVSHGITFVWMMGALARHLARLDERRERVGVLHLGRAVEARRLEVHDAVRYRAPDDLDEVRLHGRVDLVHLVVADRHAQRARPDRAGREVIGHPALLDAHAAARIGIWSSTPSSKRTVGTLYAPVGVERATSVRRVRRGRGRGPVGAWASWCLSWREMATICSIESSSREGVGYRSSVQELRRASAAPARPAWTTGPSERDEVCCAARRVTRTRAALWCTTNPQPAGSWTVEFSGLCNPCCGIAAAAPRPPLAPR